MYYPFLWGKKHELAAARALARSASGRATPIFYPVTADVAPIRSTLEQYAAVGQDIVVIDNPRAGDITSPSILNMPELTSIAANSIIVPAYQVFAGTSLKDVRGFLKAFPQRQVALMHKEGMLAASAVAGDIANDGGRLRHIFIDGSTSTNYNSQFIGTRVLLRDSFRAQQRNADYGAEDYYSDLFKTFRSLRYDGFGDFTTVGARLPKSGGVAHAVAIHLTYEKSHELWIRHFVSDRTGSAADPAGKFMEAGRKLVAFVRANPATATMATARFDNWVAAAHFPGLGCVKEATVQHHMEFVCRSW